MFIRITSKRQVTFPASVLEAMHVGPGDKLELRETPEGYVIKPMRVKTDNLAPLRGKLRRGAGTFDLEAFREQRHDPSLRD